jgi:ABC-type amino acid transport substrate-binding protein
LFLGDYKGRARSTPAFRFAALVILSFIWPLFCSAAGATLGMWRTVRIASEGARPPYNYLEANKLAGFEIDLAHDLCSRMKVTCTFSMQDWDGLIPGLLAHHFDAVMAAMEITDDARQRIAFTKPYIRMPSAFTTLKEHATLDTSPTGLVGKTIGVESGGAHQAYVEDVYKQSEIRTRSSTTLRNARMGNVASLQPTCRVIRPISVRVLVSAFAGKMISSKLCSKTL